MRSGFAFFILLLVCKVGYSSGEWIAQGARSAGMGLSSTATADFWSVTNNQAGMAFYDRTAAGIYFENRFLIKEMGSQVGAFTLKTQYGVLGASVAYSGDANYRTTKTGLAFARKFGKNFSAGIQLDYISTALGEDYGKRSNVTFDAGILVQVTEQLTFGAHTFNPMHVKLSEYNDERIPTTLNAGFGFAFSDKLLLTAEAYKNTELPMEFRSGIEYKLSAVAYARIGLCTNPGRYTFGFGLLMKKLAFDLSSSWHPQLGYSPQVSLQYSF
ncbi:MAG: hypothetical protein ACOYN4_04480 [Bacteroidales bacterium]